MYRMSNKDLLQGFEACEREIDSLRESNRSLSLVNRAYDRILSALENQNGRHRNDMCENGSDIKYKIQDTKYFLKSEIEKEINPELSPEVEKYNACATSEGDPRIKI